MPISEVFCMFDEKTIKEKEIYDEAYFKIYLLVMAILIISCFTWLVLRNQLQHRLEIQKKQVELAKEQVKMGERNDSRHSKSRGRKGRKHQPALDARVEIFGINRHRAGIFRRGM